MFIISINDSLSLSATRESAATFAAAAVQKEIDDYRCGKTDPWDVSELETTIEIIQRWGARELSDGSVDSCPHAHRIAARLNSYDGPGLRIDTNYLNSGLMKIIIQAENA